MTKPVAPLVVNDWSIYAHSVFLEQIDGLIEEVEDRKSRDPENWKKKNCTKRLAAIFKLITDEIPTDPAAKKFRQGNTLGPNRKHWFRAKFFQQYRLFFRFDSASKVIVLAWVNDENTLRAYGSKTDAYKVFKDMLDNKNPPDDFDMLLEKAKKSTKKFDAALKTESLSDRPGK